MEINLDKIDFQEVFSAAVMQSLDASKKEELIKGAVKHLVSEKGKYSDKTVLEEAFNNALYQVTREMCLEMIKEDKDLNDAIVGLIKDAAVKIMTENRGSRVDNIADKIIEGLTGSRY